MKKNLVMGTGKGYSWYVFEPFVRSFLKNVPSADLVLFVDEISDFTRNYLINIGGERIKIEPFPEYAKNCRPNNIRWKIFADYIKIHGAEYNQILTSDTRDVIFQDDVFKCFENQSNYFAYSTEADNMKGSKSGMNLNYSWIMESFGKEEADKLADKEIICDGTVIGTSKEMGIFFKKMVEYIPSFEKGHDQTVLQYLYYNNLLPFDNIIKMDGNSGEIFTAAVFHLLNPPKVKDNKILRGDGGVPAVVHQHDRQPLLAELQDKLYREKDFNADTRFTDVKSAFDQIIQLIQVNKLNIALVFFLNYILGKSTFANQGDILQNAWKKILAVKMYLKPEVELLEISLQNALVVAYSKDINVIQLIQLHSLAIDAIKKRRILSATLQNFIYQRLGSVANILLKNGNFKDAEVCLDKIIELNVPLDQNFYIIQSEIYRKLKKKAEAVAAYQKALEFD